MVTIVDEYNSLLESSCLEDNQHYQFFSVRRVNNPVTDEEYEEEDEEQEDKCLLISNRKNEYYNQTYQPSRIVTDRNSDYVNKLDQIFDLTDESSLPGASKKCNCVTFALYYYNQENLFRLYSFLTSLWQSVNNIKKCLPGWLVRIYMDPSVHSVLFDNNNNNDDIKQLCVEYYSMLISADNCEIHTYLLPVCKTARKRILRFLPLIDDEVNVMASREADGVVSYKDCKCLHYFAKSNYIFYIIPWNVNALHTQQRSPKILNSYSNWLRHYKIINWYYFNVSNTIIDVLAGTLACSLKVKREFFNCILRQVLEMIEEPLSEQSLGLFQKRLENDEPDKEDKNFQEGTELDGLEKTIRADLNIGFDEIFLLHLFRDVISVPIKEIIFGDEIIYDDEAYFIVYDTIYGIYNYHNFLFENVSHIENFLLLLHEHGLIRVCNMTALVKEITNIICGLFQGEMIEAQHLLIVIDCLYDRSYCDYQNPYFANIIIKSLTSDALINLPVTQGTADNSEDFSIASKQHLLKSLLWDTLPDIFSPYLNHPHQLDT